MKYCVYFYELCCILTSPQDESKYKQRVRGAGGKFKIFARLLFSKLNNFGNCCNFSGKLFYVWQSLIFSRLAIAFAYKHKQGVRGAGGKFKIFARLLFSKLNNFGNCCNFSDKLFYVWQSLIFSRLAIAFAYL